MLSNIRKHTQTWVAWIIVIFISLTFAVWGIGNYLGGEREDPWRAKVNGHPITEKQYRLAYDRLVSQMQQQFGAAITISPEIAKELSQQALDTLVRSEVIYQSLQKAGYRISPLELKGFIESNPTFQAEGHFSLNRYRAVLSNMYYTEQQFLDEMQRALAINQMRVGVEQSAFVLPNELKGALALVSQTRDISYTKISPEQVQKQVTVSDADVKTYYEAHKESLKKPEQVSIEYLSISAGQIRDSIAAQMQNDDPRLEQFYKENIADFSTPAEWHLAHILIRVKPGADEAEKLAAKKKIETVQQKLQAGAQFAELAKQYSDDILTKNKGGVMPWLSTSHMESSLQQALEKAKQDVTPIFESQYGFQIVKIMEKKPRHSQPFSEVRAQIKKLLANAEAEKQFTQRKEQLSDLTFSNPSTLAVASKALSLPIQRSDLFTQQGGQSGITKEESIVAQAFSEEVLVEGNNSEPIGLGDNSVVVLRVGQHIPAKIPSLSEVQDKIKAILITDKIKLAAEKQGHQLEQAIRQGEPLDTVARQYNIAWVNQSGLKRTARNLDQTLVEHVFKMPQPAEKRTQVDGFYDKDAGYTVVVLKAVHQPLASAEQSLSDSEKRNYQFQIQQGFGQLDFESYVEDLMEHAKIQYKKEHEGDNASA